VVDYAGHVNFVAKSREHSVDGLRSMEFLGVFLSKMYRKIFQTLLSVNGVNGQSSSSDVIKQGLELKTVSQRR
jgi:hypothetical protein